MSLEENPISRPPVSELMLTALDVQKGQPVLPHERLSIMSPDEWEQFTVEFVYYLDGNYEKVTRCAGAGDKGRDVIARHSEGWDNYQCKHYDTKLSVANVISELGKLVYYSWKRDYDLPAKYWFVTPKGCSPDCIDLLSNPSRIVSEIISRWDKACRNKITAKEIISLSPELLDYLSSIDFSFIGELSGEALVEKHRNTPYHSSRFGIYHLKRPQVTEDVPESIAVEEKVYIEALLHAISDKEKTDYTIESVKRSDYAEDLDRARINFFSAESLEVFSRDPFPEGCYQELKRECGSALYSVIRQDYKDGFDKYLKTTEFAVKIPYDSHPLVHFIKASDRQGLCHQLVNDRKFAWVRK